MAHLSHLFVVRSNRRLRSLSGKLTVVLKNYYKDDNTTCDEIIPFHGHRELTMFGILITYYVNEKGDQVCAREGGSACINRKALSKLCSDKGILDITEDYIKWINSEIPDVNIFIL